MTTVSQIIALPQQANERLYLIAVTLFEQASAAHQLPERIRQLVGFAATAYATAIATGTSNPERSARDMLLAAPLPDLSPEDRAIVACAAVFQREKRRAYREPAFLRLGERERERAVRIAALLQLASIIAETPAIQISADNEFGETSLLISTPEGSDPANQIRERAEQWRQTIGGLTVNSAPISMAEAGTSSALAPIELPNIPIVPDDLSGAEFAGEGARRILRRFFERMLAREDAVCKAEDPEDIHQMRVATRRLRASLQVAEAIFAPEQIRKLRKGLRRAAQALALVRDSDVFLGALRTHQAQLPEHEAHQLDPLITAVLAQRATARVALLADFEERRYTRFKQHFATFLTSPGAGLADLPETGVPARIRDLAGSAIWQRYQEWRAFEVILPQANNEQLHQARIAGKRLRYTLEFFSGALGPNLNDMLAQLAELQDHLGLLQDAVSADAQITALGMHTDPGAQAYLTHLQSRRSALLLELPRLWGRIASATYRRKLFELIIRM